MNRTKIDWADMTWNPVTGCLHGCEYCYARRIAERFGTPYDGTDLHVVNGSVKRYNEALHSGPYPYGFTPTLYRYRLYEPQQTKKPQRIFVCSMADLFGDWVPDEWIKKVMDACYSAPWHKYLFLTKNPGRYDEAIGYLETDIVSLDEPPEMWFGATATNNEQLWAAYKSRAVWLSIEPITENMNMEECFVWFRSYDAAEYPRWAWVVIGAETGNRKGKIIPKREWVQEIADRCKEDGVPVFMKESLRGLMGSAFVQEWPEGMKGDTP